MRVQDTAASRSATGIAGRMAVAGNCPKAEAVLRARESRPGIGVSNRIDG